MSNLLPMEANLLKPRFSFASSFSRAPPTPPLWEMMERGPKSKVLRKGMKGVAKPFSLLITPIQLGPMKRMPYLPAMVTNCCSSPFFSSPNSLKPADSITTRLIPFCPHISMISGKVEAGVRIAARSIWSDIWEIVG